MTDDRDEPREEADKKAADDATKEPESASKLRLARELAKQASTLSAAADWATALASASGAPVAGTLSPLIEFALRGAPANLHKQVTSLQTRISELVAEVDEKRRQLQESQVGSAFKDGYIEALDEKLAELTEKQNLAHLLPRVSLEAQQKLFASKELRSQFESDAPCPAFVLSIDIRRSTELMLKARTPRLFAEFIIGLAEKLRSIVVTNHGIFDKFTGDGVLAFFPEFFSGPDAAYLCLRAATQAHDAFRAHYDAHRHCFIAVLQDTGLGVGIDYGAVQVVHLGSEFTVVGTPVVYACRMAGAKPGHTYLNQPAYEKFAERYSAACDLQATDLDVKNEGPMLAYSARLKREQAAVANPPWLETGAA